MDNDNVMHKVSLYNPETDEVVVVMLSEVDFARAQNDMHFAQTLMDGAREAPPPHSSDVATVPHLPPAPSAQTSDDITDDGSLYRWMTPSVTLLLATFKEKEHMFLNGKQSHKKCWDDVSRELLLHGHNVTGAQCASKMRSMKKTFKNIKDHNNKSGNDKKSWQFYELMDEIFGQKAWCNPVSVASSTGLSTNQGEANAAGTSSQLPRSARESISALLGKRLRQKELHEEKKKRRHEEKMDMDRKLLEALQKLIDK